MAATLAVVLPLRLARESGYRAAPLLIGSVAAFAFSLPSPRGAGAIEYLRSVGASGLFVAILVSGAIAAFVALLRRAGVPARTAQWGGAALAVATFGGLFAAHVSRRRAHHGGDGADRASGRYVISRSSRSWSIETLLWTAGVHGPAVLAAIVTPVYLTMQMQNTHAFTAHEPLPYVVVVSLFLFVFPGGAGATLPLAVRAGDLARAAPAPRRARDDRARALQSERAAALRGAGGLQSAPDRSVRRRAARSRDA